MRSDPEHVVLVDGLLRLDVGVTEQVFMVTFAALVRDEADEPASL